MKILIIQLARLGDVYQSWPAARALRRARPGAEIHFLARPRFIGACEGLAAIDRAIAMPTREILAPLLSDRPAIEAAISGMERFIAGLRAENYGLVVNLSFSPLSSFIAASVGNSAEGGGPKVRGYSRHGDGHLAIADDASAYFYAQAGPGRGNRAHVADIFGLVAGVDLQASDWDPPDLGTTQIKTDDAKSASRRILLHVAASDARKTLSASKWAAVARALLRALPDEACLIGSPSERGLADEIERACPSPRLRNLVGKTEVSELFAEVASARLVIGGDSAPMQMASLAGTPALCLSLPTTSFWETGPRSAGSRIFPIPDQAEIGSDAIAEEARRLLAGEPPLRPCAVASGPCHPLALCEAPGQAADQAAGQALALAGQPRQASELPCEASLAWRLLQAMYMGEAFPPAPDESFLLACRRLREANSLAREQLARLRSRPSDAIALGILARADELIVAVGRIEPRAGIFARWLETERLRVGPLPRDRVVELYDEAHARLGEVLGLYCPVEPSAGAHAGAADLPSQNDSRAAAPGKGQEANGT